MLHSISSAKVRTIKLGNPETLSSVVKLSSFCVSAQIKRLLLITLIKRWTIYELKIMLCPTAAQYELLKMLLPCKWGARASIRRTLKRAQS